MKIRSLVLSVTLALCVIAIISLSAPLFSQAPQPAGQVSQLIPAVNIDRGSQRLVAQAQAAVFWNDLVATQPMGRARIALGDGSVLNVGSNSSLRVIQHDASAQQTQLELGYGRIRAKVVPLTHSGAAFQIKTPVATAGIVGTDFFLQQGQGAPPPAKIDVAVLPFSAASSVALSDANTEALAKQLGTQLGQSGQVSSAMISPAPGAAAPIGPQAAAQSGQATNATIVLVPVIQQAEAKESTHGLGGLGRFHVPGAGSGQLKHVDADVDLQVQMIRTADGTVLKTIDASSKKGFNNVNVNAEGYSTNFGAADVNNPQFQKSPLGQTLADAMANLVSQVQSQSSDALKQDASSAPAAPAFDNSVATVIDFEGSVRFCNLQQQCVTVGPGMMSTIHAGQPPDPPHPADSSFVADAQQSTEVGSAPASAPAEAASTAPPNAPVLPASSPSVACGVPSGKALPQAGAASAVAGWDFALRPFAATMVMTMKGRVSQMRYFATPGALRMEMTDTSGNGGQMIMIMRTDCRLMWTVMPEQQMYMEINLANFKRGGSASAGSQNIANAARMPDAKIDRQNLGSEQVGQYMCDKYRITVTTDKGTYVGTVWSARQLKGFPVKWLDDKTGMTMEFRDIDLGPQNPTLFMPPAGYRKMTMPGMGRQ
ncbi:MAG: DUF4412 domain-containing protein [Candidatus Acidiferrales bacterium]